MVSGCLHGLPMCHVGVACAVRWRIQGRPRPFYHRFRSLVVEFQKCMKR